MPVTRLLPHQALAYRALMLQAYALAPDAFTSTPEERAQAPESFWVQRVADPLGLSVVWGAWSGDQLVGALTLEASAREKTRHKAQLLGMYVAAAARGQGLGRALLDAAIAHAQTQPCLLRLHLTVTEGNAPALRLYQAAGFVAYGVEPLAVRTPEGFVAKVHMGRDVGRDVGPGVSGGVSGVAVAG